MRPDPLVSQDIVSWFRAGNETSTFVKATSLQAFILQKKILIQVF